MKLSNYILRLKRSDINLFSIISIIAILIAIPIVVTNSQKQTQLNSQAAPSHCPYGDTVLAQGSVGLAVSDLQSRLKKKGYDLGAFGQNQDGIDGEFGSVTKRAVQQFQHDNQVGNSSCNFSDPGSCDGIVGPQTWGALCNVDPQELQPPPGKNPPGDPPPNNNQPPGNQSPGDDSSCINAGGQCQSGATLGNGCNVAGGQGTYKSGYCLSNSSSSYLCCMPNKSDNKCKRDKQPGEFCGNELCGGDSGNCIDGYYCPLSKVERRCTKIQNTCVRNKQPGEFCGNELCGGRSGNCIEGYYCSQSGERRCLKDQDQNTNDYESREATIVLAVKLQGVGVNAAENSNPVTKTVMATARIQSNNGSSVKTVASSTDKLTYNTSSGNFENDNFKLGKVDTGNYQIVLQIPKYLDEQLVDSSGSTLFKFGSEKTIKSVVVSMNAGDVAPSPNGDNFINIVDYNALIECISSSSSCIERDTSDLNSDGIVDQKDIDLLRKNFAKEGFTNEATGFTCVEDPECKSGRDSLQLCTLRCTKKPQRS